MAYVERTKKYFIVSYVLRLLLSLNGTVVTAITITTNTWKTGRTAIAVCFMFGALTILNVLDFFFRRKYNQMTREALVKRTMQAMEQYITVDTVDRTEILGDVLDGVSREDSDSADETILVLRGGGRRYELAKTDVCDNVLRAADRETYKTDTDSGNDRNGGNDGNHRNGGNDGNE